MTILIWQIILQIILIVLNAVFACAEIAVLSFSGPKLSKLSEEGNRKARRLERLTANPARFLATIQVAITLAGFMGSAFAAENFSDLLVEGLMRLGLSISAETLDAISVVVITLLLSFITLVFGELVPKRIAMRRSEKLALSLSGPIGFLSKVFAPLVWLLTLSTNGVLRLIGIDPNAEEEDVSEEDIRTMAEAGAEQGVLDEEENNIIQNVFEFNDLTVGEAMTHRTEMVSLQKGDDLSQWRKIIFENSHTFYPIYEESADNVVGVLDSRRFFRLENQSEQEVWAKAVDEPLFVTSYAKTDDLFRQMKETKYHFAVVIDEFGGTDGIITIHDLVELLVGELEETPTDIVEIEEGTFKIACDTELTTVERELKIDLESDSATLSGWIVEQVGALPEKNDTFHYGKITVTVNDVDEKRVLEAIVKMDPPEEDED